MSRWGAATYGDPCRVCSFSWLRTSGEAVSLIEDAPAAYREIVSGATGRESVPELAWNVVGYIAHVADNLRVWGERLAAATVSPGALMLVPYDGDALAAARCYNSLPLEGGLWALDESAEAWVRAWRNVDPASTFVHPDRGSITAEDIARTNAHDVEHHRLDVTRCIAGTGR